MNVPDEGSGHNLLGVRATSKGVRQARPCASPPGVVYFVAPGDVAQLGEHHVRNVGVVGSNPIISTQVHKRKHCLVGVSAFCFPEHISSSEQ